MYTVCTFVVARWMDGGGETSRSTSARAIYCVRHMSVHSVQAHITFDIVW